MNFPGELLERQLQDILRLAGLAGPARATLIKRHNHLFRIECRGDAFFLKTYTKDWYGGDVPRTAGCVIHEASAWACLAAHELAVPEVVLARPDCDNPLGRPFIMTRQLRGEPLTELLAKADRCAFGTLLETAGDYLRRMHTITFQYPGYIMAPAGPSGPPDPNSWQHAIWSAEQTQKAALITLQQNRPRLPPTLATRLEALFSTMETALASAFQPPRFCHGDCHAQQFFLYPTAGGWEVSGVVDMEVASAGDCVNDLLKFCLEMTATFPVTTRWWEPLFAGYGHEPDFALFRLRLLGYHEANFKAYGAEKWPATREETLKHLLEAENWEQLFRK